MRRSRPALFSRIALAFVVIWSLGMGCNPSLITAIGGDAVGNVDTPDGYIAVLLMNKTTTAIQVTLDITSRDGRVDRQTLTVGPLGFFAPNFDCELVGVQFVTFTYSSTGGAVDMPANLGQLVNGQGFNCGNVIAVTAAGSPPAFSVQVF